MRHLFTAAAASCLLSLTLSPVLGQTLDYDWDGDTSSDWFETSNWEVFGGDPNPGLGDPLVPDPNVRVEIDIDGTGAIPAPVIAGGAAESFEVRIGQSSGPGLLTMDSGSLSTARDTIAFRVGDSGAGTFNLNGGVLNVINGSMITGGNSFAKGQINMTGGTINIIGSSRDLNMDESPIGNTAASNLDMSGGDINIGDVFLIDNMASVDLSGGTISAVDDIRIRRSGEVRVTGGLLVTQDNLNFGNSGVPFVGGGLLDVDGGIVRADDFGDIVGDAAITIDGTGALQINNSFYSVTDANNDITSGFISSSGTLSVSVVDVGGVDFTQISLGLPGDFNNDGNVDGFDFLTWQRGGSPNPLSASDLLDWETNYGNTSQVGAITVVPEPSSVVLLAASVAAVALRRRR